MRVIFLAALLARLLKPLSLDSFRLRRPSLQFAVGSAFMWKSGRTASESDEVGPNRSSYRNVKRKVKRKVSVVVTLFVIPKPNFYTALPSYSSPSAAARARRRRLSLRLISKLRGRRRLYRLSQSVSLRSSA